MSDNRPSSRYARIEALLPVPVLARKRVTIVGVGSMGNPVVVQLARHGVSTEPPGQIRLIDGDTVEDGNLIGTDYRMRHVGLAKTQATASIIHEVNADVNVSAWNHRLQKNDIIKMVELARQSDLLCHFADSFDVMFGIADACHEICPQLMAIFGPRCDYAEGALSVPGQTPQLTVSLGKRERQAIAKPQALGTNTGYVANFVADVCLRLLVGNGKGSDLLPCFADAPLFIIGLRRSWVFANQPADFVRSVFCVQSPKSGKTSRTHKRR